MQEVSCNCLMNMYSSKSPTNLCVLFLFTNWRKYNLTSLRWTGEWSRMFLGLSKAVVGLWRCNRPFTPKYHPPATSLVNSYSTPEDAPGLSFSAFLGLFQSHLWPMAPSALPAGVLSCSKQSSSGPPPRSHLSLPPGPGSPAQGDKPFYSPLMD